MVLGKEGKKGPLVMGVWRDQRTYPEEWVGKEESDSLGKSIRMGGPKKGGRPFGH